MNKMLAVALVSMDIKFNEYNLLYCLIPFCTQSIRYPVERVWFIESTFVTSLTRPPQESWRDNRHRNRRSHSRHIATSTEAVGIRNASVLERRVAESPVASWLLRQTRERAKWQEVHRIVMPAGGAGGHIQDDEARRRLGQRTVYVGIEATERLHGCPRDQ